MKTKRLPDVVILHCIGMLMILFGHFAQVMNQIVLGEMLITGVPLFLFLSGYLTGIKKESLSIEWLKRKCLRILTPYYLILFVVVAIFLIIGNEDFNPLQWIVLSLNIQGLTNFLFLNDISGYYSPLSQGLGHFWYVTIIMICYLIIIAFSRLYDGSIFLKKHWQTLSFFTIIIIQPILLFYNLHINYIVIFLLGWLYARNEFRITVKRYSVITLLMLFGVVTRLFCKTYMDDTLLYNKYISVISSDLSGLWIFFSLRFLSSRYNRVLEKIASWKPVILLESIIYEFFLIHHIFIKGSWSLFGLFNNSFIAVTFVILATLLLSIVCKKFTTLINSNIAKYMTKT